MTDLRAIREGEQRSKDSRDDVHCAAPAPVPRSCEGQVGYVGTGWHRTALNELERRKCLPVGVGSRSAISRQVGLMVTMLQ